MVVHYTSARLRGEEKIAMTHRFALAAALAAALLAPALASAHCDALDGPVVTTARAALETGKLAPVLAWVRAEDEREIRDAFARARAVRGGGKEARALADTWFFETLVRVHRAGEGAPYTGLKPAGTTSPVVAATDRAIAAGDPKPLFAMLQEVVHDGLHAGWEPLAKEKAPADDVAAGRRWVAAYVPFVHWVEGVHAAASAAGGHGAHAAHGAEAGAAPAHAAPAREARAEPAHGAAGVHAH
jgi:hypothetical protein